MHMSLMFDYMFSIACRKTQSEIISIVEFGSDDNNGVYILMIVMI